MYPGSNGRRKENNGIPVRVIEWEATAAGEPGTGEETGTFLLITTILDPDTGQAEDLAGLCARRWEIESSFDVLKTRQRGPTPSGDPWPGVRLLSPHRHAEAFTIFAVKPNSV